MILVIDNYDSFVENLARYARELYFETVIYRNDKISLDYIIKLNPSHIIISPGPCTPTKAGLSIDIIKTFGKSIPILGVCLGHQVIGAAYGAKINKAKVPMHGKQSQITHFDDGLFTDLPNPLKVARYHSLIVGKNSVPDCLEITAISNGGEIMALQHKECPVFGVQVHPESVLTNAGHNLLKNFLIR